MLGSGQRAQNETIGDGRRDRLICDERLAGDLLPSKSISEVDTAVMFESQGGKTALQFDDLRNDI
jgi:hypothetical protein